MKTRREEALQFATLAHNGQFRKYGMPEPYVNHCIRVANMVALFTDNQVNRPNDEDTYIAALLHDTLEDTLTTETMLLKLFGDRVTNLVMDLTDPPHSAGNRAKRKEMTRERLSKSYSEAQTIKYADIIDNLDSIVRYDKDFAQVFLDEVSQLVSMLDRGNPALRSQTIDWIAWGYSQLEKKDEIDT
jgi:(p)ppGpp synthase/HD superfamily hydrolase